MTYYHSLSAEYCVRLWVTRENKGHRITYVLSEHEPNIVKRQERGWERGVI